MQNQSCPACGGLIAFKSRFSTLCVCQHCQSVLKRADKSLTIQGHTSVLTDDYSVIQLGTQGEYHQVPFEVIGLIKVVWEDGFWNEWHVIEQDGQSAWLIEAMGLYSYVQEIKAPATSKPATAYHVGQQQTFKNQPFQVVDIKHYECQTIYGEIPFHMVEGLKGTSVDFRSENNQCAYISYFSDEAHYYIGEFHDIASLKLNNLKQIEGW